jgi:CO/xanthine dehydrogenase FAD-binding subunit
MGAYHRPDDLDTALRLRAETGAIPLAGATDLFPADAARTAWGELGLDQTDLLDLAGLMDLARIDDRGDRIEIGALVTWAAAASASLPPWFDAVRAAAREVGGAQIQNRGTIAGNLCNASPAADGVPPLLALDARVRLASARKPRELPLADFILGNRLTALEPHELLTHIIVPKPPPGARSVFLKLGARRYLVISIAMVAATTTLDARGRIADARIAVGACSPMARRLTALEARILGLTPADAAAGVSAADLEALAPIDDVRASAAYRRQAALVLVRRALAGHPPAMTA